MYITNPSRKRKISAPLPPQDIPTPVPDRESDQTASPSPIVSPPNPAPSPMPAPSPISERSPMQSQAPTPTPVQESAPRAPERAPEQSPSQPMPTSGTGYVIVRATTASGAIPLEGALATVKEYEGSGDIIATRVTNISGLTEKIALPAPPRALSLGAGRGKAYSSYNIEVALDGYIPQSYLNVPIFDGVTAMQSADLIPLPENGEADRYDPYAGIFYESENPKLETKGGT